MALASPSPARITAGHRSNVLQRLRAAVQEALEHTHHPTVTLYFQSTELPDDTVLEERRCVCGAVCSQTPVARTVAMEIQPGLL